MLLLYLSKLIWLLYCYNSWLILELAYWWSRKWIVCSIWLLIIYIFHIQRNFKAILTLQQLTLHCKRKQRSKSSLNTFFIKNKPCISGCREYIFFQWKKSARNGILEAIDLPVGMEILCQSSIHHIGLLLSCHLMPPFVRVAFLLVHWLTFVGYWYLMEQKFFW